MNILIHWKKDYSLNIKEIDQQHKKLVDMINVLYDSLVRDENYDILGQTLSDMTDYTFVHFKNEEKYFAQLGYKDAPSHMAEHQYFLEKVKTFRSKFLMQGLKFTPEVIAFLQEWLVNHIILSDKKYVESFIQAGVK